MRVVGREELIEQERTKMADDQAATAPIITSLAAHVHARWEKARMGRSEVEARLLDCQRRRLGVYSEAKIAQIRKQAQSEIYMKLTGIKCATAAAWLSDVILQPGERPWDIKPTPVPDLAVRIDDMMQQIVTRAEQEGQILQPEELVQIKSEAEAEIEKQLSEATSKMKDLIEDQLVEGGFYDALNDFLDDIVTYPSAFLKGAVMRQRTVKKWVQESGKWIEKTDTVLSPEWERVSPFNIYPAPDSVNIDGSWLIERHKLSRSELRRFIGVSGYDPDAIALILNDYSEGLHEQVGVDTQRKRLDSAGTRNAISDDETIEAIELWDTIQGKKLILWDAGRGLLGENIDPLGEYRVNAWKAGSHVFRVLIVDDDSLSSIYYKASFDRTAGSFWGIALPEVMADIQDICNGIARALMKNVAVTAGPQVIVHTDRLPAGETITNIYPLKLWQVVSGSNGSPIEFYQPSSNASELMQVYDRYEEKADVYTGIPRYTYGSSDVKGAGSTASGLSMLMTAASKGIKRVVGHIDRNVIEPNIRNMYDFNMRHHPDMAVKLDAKVSATGAKSLIVKEQMQQKRTEFMNATLNPMDAQIIGVDGRAKLLESTAKALDLPDGVVPSAEVLRQRMQQQQQDPAQ